MIARVRIHPTPRFVHGFTLQPLPGEHVPSWDELSKLQQARVRAGVHLLVGIIQEAGKEEAEEDERSGEMSSIQAFRWIPLDRAFWDRFVCVYG